MGEGVGTVARRDQSIGGIKIRAWSVLWVSLAVSFAGYVGYFVVLHLEAVGWASGQVLDSVPGYWDWFYRTILSADLVNATRRSDLAARFQFWLILAYVPVSMGYLGIIGAMRALPADTQPRLRLILGAAALFSVPLLLLPNLLSSDVYSYISFGRIAAVWNGNPFTDAPNEYPSDMYLQYVYWSNVPSVYGPPWIYLSMLVTGIVEHTWSSPAAYVLAYKLAVALLHLVNGAILWAILTKWQPQRRAWGTALYVLNPLTLVEFAGNVHNDVLMITCILLGVWFHLHGLWTWTAVAWSVAVLAKWIALPLLPLYGLVILWTGKGIRMRAARLAGLVGLFAVVTSILYLPFWRGLSTLEVLFDAPPQKLMVNSIGHMVVNQILYTMYSLDRWPHPQQAPWSTIPLASGGTGRAGERDLEGTELRDWRTDQRVLQERYNRQQTVQQNEVTLHALNLSSGFRWAGLALVMLICLVGAAITRDLWTLLLALAWIFFVYVAIGSVWVWPWYATWFVALAAMLDWRVTGRTAIILSLCAPIIYPLTPILPLPNLLELARPILAFGPALAFATYHLVRIVRERFRARRTTNDQRPTEQLAVGS